MPDWMTASSLTVVAAWVGAVTGVAGLVVNALNRRDTRRAAHKESDALKPWATLTHGHVSEDGIRFVLFIHHRRAEGFWIKKVRLIRPRGAEIVTTYSSGDGPTDWPSGTREGAVEWYVSAPTFEDAEFIGSRSDIWIRDAERPGSRLSAMVGSAERQKLYEIELSGETMPPMRESIRIKANAVIAP